MDYRNHRPSFAALRRLRAYLLTGLALLLVPLLAWSQATDLPPVVFVHGQSGSAQQFETQAMRFTSNGYPQNLLFAFEYDTSKAANPLAALDAFIDGVLAQTGSKKVYAIGHSRGTTVWTSYLGSAAFNGPAKVAKYVNIDGVAQPTLPGGVPTIGIWGEWNTADSGYNRRGNTNAVIGPDPGANYYFGTKSHTELATSAEAFALAYQFFTGRAPATTDVVPEPPGQVQVGGRAVIFPENLGYAGAKVEVWLVEPRTGQRMQARPLAQFDIDSTGNFGPLKVNGTKHYELAVIRPPANGAPETVHHFYFEPFSRSDLFVRLNTSRPNTSLELYLPREPSYTNLVLTRQRDFWGDQGANSDQLLIDGLNVLQANTSPRSGVNLAVFAYDAGPRVPPSPVPGPPDGQTDLSKGELFPFTTLTFLTAVDVSIPASPDASGSVAVTDVTRGSGNASTVNVPNWPADVHRITVQFRDDDQAVERFTDPQLGPRGRLPGR
jgi:pimeloyl-ACP methyl ester carboxylesterase